MDDEKREKMDSVRVSMEIAGDYDAVVSKLEGGERERAALRPLVEDVDRLLETVVRIDGGTRSAIAQELSDETAAAFDAQAVVDTLQVLERYDLVVLEGNTWKPGPALQG